MRTGRVSVIIPVYNGAATVERVVLEVIKEIGSDLLEVILVNDGSADTSDVVCAQLAETHPTVLYIPLRRNFGEHNAVMCGLTHARGEYMVVIDDDLQHPPAEIRKLITKAEEGFDVVYSSYEQKAHGLWRNLGSSLVNRAAVYLFDQPPNLYLSSFKLIQRETAKEIVQYRGPFPHIDGLLFRIGVRAAAVQVRHAPRAEGRSGYSLAKLIHLAFHLIFNYSLLPARSAFVVAGVCVALGGLTLSGTLFALGITSLLLAVVGEYAGRCLLELNGTPQWVQREPKASSSEDA
jgi:glycosyltransferase involved in cell wall biosynthesis